MVKIIVSNADAKRMLKNAEWHINWLANCLDPRAPGYKYLTEKNIAGLKKQKKSWEKHARQIKNGLIVARVKF